MIGFEGQLYSLTALSAAGQSPSIYRWIGGSDPADTDNFGEWVDDHYITRQETFPEGYTRSSSSFVGRTVNFKNTRSDANETRSSGLYRWNGGAVNQWELVAAPGVTITETHGTTTDAPIINAETLNFIGGGIRIERNADDETVVDIRISGGSGVPSTITPTLTRTSAAPTTTAAQSVELTVSWVTSAGVTVNSGDITSGFAAAVNFPVTASPQVVTIPNVTFPLGTTRTFNVTLTGTNEDGDTVTGTASVDVAFSLAQPTAASLVPAGQSGLFFPPYANGSVEYRDTAAVAGTPGVLEVTLSGGSAGAYTLETTTVRSEGSSITADANGRYPLTIQGPITDPITFSSMEVYDYPQDSSVPSVSLTGTDLTYPVVRSLRLGVAPNNTPATFNDAFLTDFSTRSGDIQAGVVTQEQISSMGDRPVTTTADNRHIYFAYSSSITATPRILVGQVPNNNLFTRVGGASGVVRPAGSTTGEGFIVYVSNQAGGFRPLTYDLTIEF